MKKLVIPIFHLLLLIASLTSPFWIDWKIVSIGFVLYILQKMLFKGCLLSFAEFGNNKGKPKNHFTPYYLKKIFKINAKDHVVMRYLDYVVAPMVPIAAILLQAILHFNPWLNLK